VKSSTLKKSVPARTAQIASLGAVDAGAQVSLIRWLDFPLPIYDGDWEAENGLTERARALKALLAQYHALLVATPEYNGGYPALLKNALDWASRPSESDPTGLEVFAGKVAAVVSASPGVLGGMRAQIAIQISLNKLGMLVIPNSFALCLAYQAYDEQRRLKDGNVDQNVRGVGAALVRTAIALAPTPKRSELGDGGGAGGVGWQPSLAGTLDHSLCVIDMATASRSIRTSSVCMYRSATARWCKFWRA
jgi:chromate reductase, NAD(P)H dehydrogenase (quinone)